MKNDNKKKGLFSRFNLSNKIKKSSGCCNFEVEEIPEEEQEKENEKKSPKDKGKSCYR